MKRFLLGVIALVETLNATCAMRETPSFQEVMHERYCSLEAIEDQFQKLRSDEEYQIVAAWVQLRLLHASNEVFDRFTLSDQWKEKTPHARRLITMLSYGDNRKMALRVYRKCFEKIATVHRTVPGLGDDIKPLVQPDELRKKMSGLY